MIDNNNNSNLDKPYATMQGGQSWGVGGREPPYFGQGGRGVAGGRCVSWTRGRVVTYYYILSCTGSIFESGDFLREIE